MISIGDVSIFELPRSNVAPESSAGRLANANRNGYGKLNTRWRTGCAGKTSFVSGAAPSAMRCNWRRKCGLGN